MFQMHSMGHISEALKDRCSVHWKEKKLITAVKTSFCAATFFIKNINVKKVY